MEALDPPLLRDFVRTVFEKMKLAGEAGTLLKIEEEIRSAIQDARNAAHAMRDDLFTQGEAESEDFFDSAEERIYESLQNYAESAESGDYQKRLFAEDAAYGFAFIDLCRKRYDALVMNPPFGSLPNSVSNYTTKNFGGGRPDAYRYFFFRASQLSYKTGFIGELSSRTFHSLEQFKNMRESMLRTKPRLEVLADFGPGVLDATVEASAYVCNNRVDEDTDNALIFIKLEDSLNRPEDLYLSLKNLNSERTFVKSAKVLSMHPGGVFAYWLPLKWSLLFLMNRLDFNSSVPSLSDEKNASSGCANVRQGLIPGDTFRFTRLSWEIPRNEMAFSRWAKMIKGGSFSPYWASEPWHIDWLKNGKQIKAFAEERYGGASRTIKNEHWFFKDGLTYPNVNIALNIRITKKPGAVITNTGYGIFPENNVNSDSLAAYLNSSLVAVLCEAVNPGRKFDVGYVAALPVPEEVFNNRELANASSRIYEIWQSLRTEEGQFWRISLESPIPLTQKITDFFVRYKNSLREIRDIQKNINELTFNIVGFSSDDREFSRNVIKATRTKPIHPSRGIFLMPEDISKEDIDKSIPDKQTLGADLILQLIGLSFSSGKSILVDDPDSMLDIVRNLNAIGDKTNSNFESDLDGILGGNGVRHFINKKAFSFHLKKSSVSPRKAPIYWPLSTESGSYTLWIYYHRLTDQTLYQCVSDFIEPKIEQCEKDLQMLNQQFELGQADGETNDQISELKTLINELKNFRDDLLDVAKLPYKPNLNDGVQITAAPLWKCFRLGAWQKTLKDTWKKLEKGDYDWAHLSYSIWPERVKDKCIKDKSLAIAHGLEEVYIEPPAKAKRRKKSSTEALDLE